MKFKSIASRIIFSVVPVIALFTFLYVLITYQTANEQINAQFNERMRESLDSASLSIHTELVMNANIAESLAIYAETCSLASIENGELAAFLLRMIPSNKNTVGGGIWFEPYALYKDKRYFGPYVYVKNGQAIFAPEYEEAVDYHSTEWYRNGKNSKGETVWSNVYYDPVADVTMITSTVPFDDKNGHFRGVTTSDMALTDIKAISSAISIGQTGRAFILGANGEYISFFDDSRTINMRITDDPDQALADLGKLALSTDNGSASIIWNGRQFRAFFTLIPETHWHLIVMIDTAEVGQSANDIVLTLAVVPIVGLLLATICIILVSRRLTKVADKVNHFADRAASGDLSERIDITEHDEFGLMEDRLNAMMDKMAEMSERSEKMLQVAQSASRAKTEFLSKMSHEMRTPMNAIMGMLQVAERTGDNEKIRDCMDKINHASNNLLDLINNILDMAKIEANKLELDPVNFSIQDVFDSAGKVFWVQTEAKHLTMTMELDPSVPHIINADRFRYSQVLTNLLSNAVKFTPSGGQIAVSARVLEERSDTLIIETQVADTGIGIAPEKADKLFLSFEQADSSISRKYGGTGLGLTISKSLSELMGGRIWFEPNNPAGSRFLYTIVARMADETKLDFAPSAEDQPPKSYDFTGKRILLAEDVAINREVVAALLEGTGIELDYAENGREACEKFAASPDKYDLIFMDIQMPEMDGLTATRQIRQMDKKHRVPIVAMSANAFKEDVEASLSAGMDGHLSKPVNRELLLDTLDTMLR